MALRYSFDLGDEATRLEQAVEKVLAKGLRTPDLMTVGGGTQVGTEEMGAAIVAALDS
jgi:3-isopropylmalate dehydrogenase